jgi:hypothetical protein
VGGNGISWSGIIRQPMTVLLSAFVPDSGFIIAADGRRLDAQTKVLITDTAQKIYSGDHPDCTLVFGWVGATATDTPLCGHFDFAQQTLAFLSDKRDSRYKSWDEFVTSLSTCVYASLIICAGGKQVYKQNIPSDPTIVAVRLAGYFHGKPAQATVRFSHENGRLNLPSIYQLSDLRDVREPEIFPFSGDHGLLNETISECPQTLAETTEVIRNYIADCAAKNAEYGGHTHIGFLTPDGFNWDTEPLK